MFARLWRRSPVATLAWAVVMGEGRVHVPYTRLARSASRLSIAQQNDPMPGLPSAAELYQSCKAEIATFPPDSRAVSLLNLLYARAASADQACLRADEAHSRADEARARRR
jgi:hypothetical protein